MPHEDKRAISFLVTTDCNLACRYCVNETEEVKEHKTLDLEFAKAGLEDFFVKTRFGKNNNRIRFYGIGEPTLEIELIKQITDYARKLIGDKLEVELQTNGAFSRQTAEWIRENVDDIWVSIDGPPDIQDKNRDNSSDKVVKNIEFLLQGNCFVGTRATIRPEDIHRQIEILDYFKSLGIAWVYAEPEFPKVRQDGSKCQESVTPVNLNVFLSEFIKAHKHSQNTGMHYGNFFTMNFDSHCNYACRSCIPMPQLNPDGTLSGCDLAYSAETQLRDFIFGEFDGKEIVYFPEKIDKIRKRHVDNIEECKDCDIKTNCGGGCAGLAYHATGNLFGIVKEFCEATKYLAKHIPRNTGCSEHLHP